MVVVGVQNDLVIDGANPPFMVGDRIFLVIDEKAAVNQRKNFQAPIICFHLYGAMPPVQVFIPADLPGEKPEKAVWCVNS